MSDTQTPDTPAGDGAVEASAFTSKGDSSIFQPEATKLPPAQPVTPPAPVVEVVAVEEAPEEFSEPKGPVFDPGYREGVLGVVYPGDHDDLAFFVVRSLGQGDSGVYEGGPVSVVQARQEAAGLEPTGVVEGETWALVLPEIKQHAMGQPKQMLMHLLGVPATNRYDDAIEARVREVQEAAGIDVTGYVNGATWLALIDNCKAREA